MAHRTMEHRIVLYSKPGCHLCSIMHLLLLGLQQEFDLTIEETDITRDAKLFERYWDKIPVLLVDDQTEMFAPVRIAEVREALLKKSQV